MDVAIRCNGSRLLGLGDLAFGRDLRDALAGRGLDCVIVAESSLVARGFLGEGGASWLPEGVGQAEELDWLAARAEAQGWRHLFVVRFDRPIDPYAALGAARMSLGCVDFSGRALPGFDLAVNWDPGAPARGAPGCVVLAGPRFVPLRPGVGAFRQAAAHSIRSTRRGQRHCRRTEAPSLLHDLIHAAVGAQAPYLKFRSKALRHRQRLPADGTGGTQHKKFSQSHAPLTSLRPEKCLPA